MIIIILKIATSAMPYSATHKENTRQQILASAYALFSTRGFDAVTVDTVMQDCQLTRGGFYAHFESKAALYRAAISYGASHTALAGDTPRGIAPRAWLSSLLDAYLSLAHVDGEQACPLAFLATDVASRDSATKSTYTHAYAAMNRRIRERLGTDAEQSAQQLYAMTTLMIGAVAVARTVDEPALRESILEAARNQAHAILNSIPEYP